MNKFTNFLIFLSYAILAGAGAVAAAQFLALSYELVVLGGGLALAMFTQIHASLNRGQERKILEREIEFLSRSNVMLVDELEELKEQTDDLAHDFEEKSKSRAQKVVAEVRVLETLIQQLAEEVERKAREAAIAEIRKARGPAKQVEDKTDPVGNIIDSLESVLGNVDKRDRAEDSVKVSPFGFADSVSEEELLNIIRASLEHNRVDLYLQPIMALPQRRIRFYEALSRLRSRDGEIILPAQYLRVAEPAGLMSVIDNLLLFRCVQIVRRLIEKNKNVGIFCNISINSLQDSDFFPQFLEFMSFNTDLVPHLIFEFSQETVEAIGSRENANLDRLAGMGFQFSMDRLATLDLDLPDLRHRNFRFIKVSADMFLNRMDEVGANIHAADFNTLLTRFGIDLIVERIETEQEAVESLEYEIRYGQGFLFGEPRPLEEVEARIEAAAERFESEDELSWTPIPYFGNDKEVVNS